ncbi:MAG TPA: MBL fold metallo-hydrolase [Trebonia sp.]|jgi:glyoxylase-like metal-dependent hydrolase (beta-lactamase superfamily II)
MTAVPAGQDVTGTRQLEAWLQRVTPPVEQLATDLWSIPVPIPRSPLRYVSSYAFAAAGGGLVLLDAGWNAEESWQALVGGLETIGASLTDVRGVLVTHMHFDHAGLAGRVRDASGAWVAMHPADRALLTRRGMRDPELAVELEVAFMRSLGAPAAEAAEAVGTPDEYVAYTSIGLPDRDLTDGEMADVPGWRLRAVHTPGHTPGHLVFVDELSQRLFSGDHILPRITPNISIGVSHQEPPLADYLRSLVKVRDLDVDEIFPAHEWRFRGLAERADGIAAHHEHRLNELLAAIAAHPDESSWVLAGHLTWSRSWDQYNGRMRISAVTETAAHVQELVGRGLAVSSGGDVPTYGLAGRAVG